MATSTATSDIGHLYPAQHPRASVVAWMAIGGFALLLPLALLRIYGWSAVDAPISLALNQIAHRSEVFDFGVRRGMELYSVKGLAAMALVYAAYVDARTPVARQALIAGAAAACIAGLASRAGQIFLPKLPRPLVDPALGFTPPYGMADDGVGQWNSFPSDTSALLFGLAAAILVVNRRWGLLALATATLAAVLRIYCGRHYATDILAGAALGAAFALGAAALTLRGGLPTPLVDAMRRWPGALGGIAFFFAAHAAMQFNEPRSVVGGIMEILRSGPHSLSDQP